MNDTGQPIHLFEVDYPSASFGGQDLAPNAVFHYRFKIIGEGATKVLWTDAGQHDHTASGPALREGQEGTLTVRIQPQSARWESNLRSK